MALLRNRGSTSPDVAAAVLDGVHRCANGVLPSKNTSRASKAALQDPQIAGNVSVVSVMAVNNEVGSISPLRQVAKVVRAHAPNAVLHTDAVQAACWQDLREISKLVDVLSVSAHKFGGPKGMGITMQRLGLQIDPLIVGGGQERDRRSGTHNVAGIMATAAALRVTDQTRNEEVARVTKLRDALVDGICSEIDDVLETVPRDKRVAGIAHMCIAGCESESVLYLLDEAMICASAASACKRRVNGTRRTLRGTSLEATSRSDQRTRHDNPESEHQ